MRNILSLFAFALVLFSSVAIAQDYPYDTPEPSSKQTLPKESPEDSLDSSPARKLPALFRVGFKFGSEFSIYQYEVATGIGASHTGLAFDGLISFGWDLPYQPLFLELETGYKGLFLTSNTTSAVHIVPLRFGTFRRFRTGPQGLLKIGVIPSIDYRTQVDTATLTRYSMVVPSLSFALAWEHAGLLIQPEIGLYRIESRNSFLSFAILGGYRF